MTYFSNVHIRMCVSVCVYNKPAACPSCVFSSSIPSLHLSTEKDIIQITSRNAHKINSSEDL